MAGATAQTEAAPVRAIERPSAIAPGDLADLVSSFSEVTARLEATHDQLRAEVARLNRELSEANQQIERSRRLAALGEMAAGIAHEVRNPLGSIRLYARMLDEDLADRPQEQSTVRKVAGAARALDGVVGDVLTFAREFRLRLEPCDAAELIERAVSSCAHDGVPGWGRVELACLAPSAGTVVFEADPSLAVQALVNVIRNAIEAANEGVPATGEAPAGPPRVVVDAFWRDSRESGATSGKVAVVRVRDNGPGVSEEVIGRMFNPFFTTRSTGTGLGLAIVHRIVDAHAGRVTVRDNRSDPERQGEELQGATVELVFPGVVGRA